MDAKSRLFETLKRSARVLCGLALAAFLLLGHAGPALAEAGDRFTQYNLEIPALVKAGELDEALSRAQLYAAEAREDTGPESLDYATAITWLAWVKLKQEKPDEAVPLLKEALAIREAELPANHILIATSLHNLAEAYERQGKVEEATALLQRADEIKANMLGRDALALMPKHVALLEKRGKTKQAAALRAEYERRLADRFGPNAAEEAARRFGEPVPQEFEAASYAVVKIFYATDRKNTGDADPADRYLGDRGELVLGEAKVSIPRDHRMGEVETPSIWRVEWCADPERFVVLLDTEELDPKAFYKKVRNRVAGAPGKSAFVFVHGYNTAFADAAKRTAQVAYDLGFAGAPVLYSWPSQATFAGYKVDETNAEWTRHDFQKFLKDFAEQSDAEDIYLIAHSMGTRVLTGALKELFLEEPQLRKRFDEIVLAAPDIDADTFERDIAPKIAGVEIGGSDIASEPRATLYASSGDYALSASKTFAGYPRAGDTADGITIVPGFDTIDASSATTDFVGHGYYASSESVLGDLRDLILEKKRAEEREGLAPVEIDAGRYWTFGEAGQAGEAAAPSAD